MNAEALMKAVGGIRSEYVERYAEVKKRSGFKRYGWMTAAAAVLIAAFVMIPVLKPADSDGRKGNTVLNVPPLPQSGSSVGAISDFEFAASDYPTLTEAMVYKTSPAHIDPELLRNAAKKLGFGELTVGEDADRIVMRDENGNSIIVFKASGTVDITRNITHSEPGEPKADAEYISIASDLLTETGLLSAEYAEKEPGVWGNGEGKTVCFMYKDLDGIEVNGVAPRIIVDMTLSGDVDSILLIRRDFETYEKYPLISVMEAFEAIKRGEGALFCGEGGSLGTVTGVKLVYYNREVMDDYPYLLPVYVFEGECDGTRFTAVIYAIDPAFIAAVPGLG